MFDHLIESNRKPEVKRGLGTGFFSLVLHGGVVAAAIYSTLKVTGQDDAGKLDTMMVYMQQQEQQKQQEEPPPVLLDVPLKGFQTIIAPTDIPTDIPPIDLKETFDPKDYTGVGVEGGLGSGVVPSSDQVYLEAVVEERPERLSGPLPQYPEILRQAGVQGQVMVEVVIDTTGRAIPNTIRILQSAHTGFDQPAKTMVLQSLFRPGRVSGRAVKVLVRVPVNFNFGKR